MTLAVRRWLGCVVVMCSAAPLYAEVDLLQLAGFDAPRIEKLYPANEEESIGELAKLVYRLNRLSRESLQGSIPGDGAGGLHGSDIRLGRVVLVEGRVGKVQSLAVPDRLIEFLGLRTLERVTLDVADSTEVRSVEVVTSGLPPDTAIGDRVSGLGVVIETRESSGDQGNAVVAIAALPLQWFPENPQRVGWKLLTELGVGLGQLPGVASRNRQPLSSDDTELFYQMLSAAERISQTPSADRVAPAAVEPIELLKNPTQFTGEWIRMDVEVVQITRISVTEPSRVNQLGADHYYQIDAMGDLGDVKVKIDSSGDAADGGPVFQNRFPISLVFKTLPGFLQAKLDALGKADSIVVDITVPVSVNAFFFRLWSYPTAYMERFGGGDQFGPLLIGADMINREPTSADPAGVKIFGKIAAVAVGMGMLAMLVWSHRIRRGDRVVQQQRKQREAEELRLPE